MRKLHVTRYTLHAKKINIIIISFCLFAISTLAIAQDTYLHLRGGSKVTEENPKELISNAWRSLNKRQYDAT